RRDLIGLFAHGARAFHIHTYNLCFLGFGNVNRTLAQLLADREPELRERHGITFRITGIATRRLGWLADPNGIDAKTFVERALLPARPGRSEQKPGSVGNWLKAARADV